MENTYKKLQLLLTFISNHQHLLQLKKVILSDIGGKVHIPKGSITAYYNVMGDKVEYIEE